MLTIIKESADLLNVLDKKVQESPTPAESKPTSSRPSVLDIFDLGKPEPEPEREQANSMEITQNTWTPGQPLIAGYAVQEDINKRGMRRKKKNWQATGKVEMEVI